ncbi:MAG: hypothetical protein IKH02_07295 [Prevotella sp.]|jgi:DnaJ-class molecular chaperone|nr:hypothetical protein [Prevotella sp.]
MKQIKIIFVILTCVALTSCSTLASIMVEDTVAAGLSSAKPSSGAPPSQKAQDKEAERLKKEGKCPICRGLGKTPDGRYDCTTCNGTGKYQESSK